MIQPVHWLFAAVLAVALHMGLLGFATSHPDVAMERSAGRSGAVWGLPMEMVADVADPAMEPTETADAVDPTEAVEDASPVEPEPPVEPDVTDPTDEIEAVEASEPAPVEPEATEIKIARTASEAPELEEPEITEPVEVAAWEGGIAVVPTPVEEVEPVETTASIEVATLTPVVSEAVEVVAEDATPMPRVRPADVPRVEAPPKPKTVAKPKVAEKKPPPTKAASLSKTRSTGRPAPASAPAGEQVGTGGKQQGAGGQQLVSSYSGKIAAHLRRHKRYPKEAAQKRQSGTATVTFSISKSGGVRSARLARSSGNSAFDREVVAMVRRAEPFPPIPTAVGKSAMTFTVPVRFQPR